MADSLTASWTASHFAILILTSLSTFGANYVYNMLNVLQPVLTGRIGCSNTSAGVPHCCHDCLGIDDREYNLLHTELFYTCAASLFICGYLLDKLGNWILIVLVSFTLGGICFITIGASVNGTAAVKPLVFIGIFIQGAGLLTSLAARGRIIAKWFLDKEIAFAFGAAAAINRLGAFPSYMLTEVVRESAGLPVTLWVGAGVCLLSLLCAIAAVLIDSRSGGAQARELEAERRRAMSLRDVARFPAEYWILVALIGFYVGAFKSTQANATEMIHEKFGLRKTLAAVVAGEMLYISAFLSPPIGLILDKTGRKGYAILFASLLQIPALWILGFTDLTPVIGCFIMGVSCCFTPVLMSSVLLLVDTGCIGMATALAHLSSTICTGTIHLVLSGILGRMDKTTPNQKRLRWQLSIAFIMGAAAIAAALAVTLVAMSFKSGGALTRKLEVKAENDEEDANAK